MLEMVGIPAERYVEFPHQFSGGMSEETVPRATKPYKSFSGIQFIEDYPKTVIHEGDVIELGGRKLEVFEIPCHAAGSLAFLDRVNRILFTGDEFGPFCNLSGSISQFVNNMQKLMSIRSEFDYCLGGNGRFDASYVEKCLALGRDILAGTAEVCEGKGGKKPDNGPPAPEGVTVYGRKSPHPGDSVVSTPRMNQMVSGHDIKNTFSACKGCQYDGILIRNHIDRLAELF